MKSLIALSLLIVCPALAEVMTNEYQYNHNEDLTTEQLERTIAFAEEGNAHAAYELFERYKYGRGVEKDLMKGAKWACVVEKYNPRIVDTLINTPEQLQKLKQSAESGDDFAAYTLAWRYEEGMGALIEKDQEAAERWYVRAAELENRKSMFRLATAYRDGAHGYPKDYAAALKWFAKCYELQEDKATRTDRFSAALEIAGLYRHGDATLPANDAKASEWLKTIETMAAANEIHYYRVRHALAVACHDGRVLPKDRERALKLFTEGANKNERASMMRTAAAHYNGYGTVVDKALAREWVNKLKSIHSYDWSLRFAEVADPQHSIDARRWYAEDLTAAEELQRKYEKTYFLETAKGQTDEAFEMYRHIIATKATHGTYPVITKALERLLAHYSDPENDPAQISYKIAREYLALCREHDSSPGIYNMPEAREAEKTVPELQALDELCRIHDRLSNEILMADESFRKATKAYAAGEIDGYEYDMATGPVAKKFYAENEEYRKTRRTWEHYIHIRNTRLLEYLIDDYERRGVPFPTDWYTPRRDHLIRSAVERAAEAKSEGGSE